MFSRASFRTVHIILSLPCGEQKRQNAARVKYWEIIARNLKKAGWSLGYVSTVDCQGRTIWIADAHRDDGQRFIVRADEILMAFVELESVLKGTVLVHTSDQWIPNNGSHNPAVNPSTIGTRSGA
jgi:hypothetical protein